MGDSDFSLTTFSSGGKLNQIESALKAVSLGGQCVGVKAKNGAVIACESKPSSPLVEKVTNLKVQKINDNVGIVYSGVNTDFHVILKSLRKASIKYSLRLGVEMPTREVVKHAAHKMQYYTQIGGVRPFGVSLLIIGWEELGPTLWQVDPSGTFWAWKATALGKRSDGSRTFLERRYSEDQSVDDAIHTAISTLKEGFDGQLTAELIEIGVVDETRKFRTLSTAEIRDFLTEV
ncbi:Family T1, proteasome alpha subunit, threonine peptidase [Trichomonas vaginalis G3]|uniref:Family T1, proteasome alpha subunit, threonine peptidase n=1 Tax=Trichomonas vaginalis (strain ATCC PRA-98 / G3) TaxID=412133 RepID=A2FJV7_TRIV3|nr:Family T1, proteasome alpha subunit, threonine peptidase [Trichomonas vaginalis G3]|eukprot:XP_001307739.1 Family T1, proteasome alpha subunit, threonine peptidase [Trichomonas vaginalis G3]